MKVWYIFFVTIMASLFSTSFVFAENNETQYMVKLKSNCNAVKLANAEDSELYVVSEELNIFKGDLETIEKLKELNLVEVIEEDVQVELAEDITTSTDLYNDEYYDFQWYFQKHNLQYAKDKLGTGKGVRVATIDSGVTIQPDFNSANIEKGYNYIRPEYTGNDVSSTDSTTVQSHGTGVASIICSQSNNEIGIAGIADDVTIVPFVIYQNNQAPLSNVITAIEDAVKKYDCDVINMSLTCGTNSSLLQDAVNYANDKNVIVVAAVGNGRTVSNPASGRNYLYPAACENVIGVGAVDQDFTTSYFSQLHDYVDISAAGSNLILANSNGGYTSNSKGTSFSAPIITGFASLFKAHYPDMNNEEFLQILKAGSYDTEELGYDIYTGFGVFDAKESVRFFQEKYDFFVSPTIEKDSKLRVKVFGKDISGLLNFAIYDMNDKLINVIQTDFKTTNEIFTKEFDYVLNDSQKVKIFAFDNFQNMIPLGKTRIIE